jgi:hypothetical protein
VFGLMPIRIRLSILMPIQIMTGFYPKFLFYLLVSVIGVNFKYFGQYLDTDPDVDPNK